MQDDELSSGGDSDHTDSERSVASLDNHLFCTAIIIIGTPVSR